MPLLLLLLPLLLLAISAFHTWLLASWWPGSLVSITPSPNGSLSLGVLNGLAAYVIASACLFAFALVRRKQAGIAVGVLALLVTGVVGYLKLPLALVFMPSIMSVGSLCGLALAVVSYRLVLSRGESEKLELPRISFLTAFCLAYNALLLIAPSSVIFPTGFAGDVFWAQDTLILRHEDSVSINSNLLYIIIRDVVSLIVGNSLLANSLVTTVMVSIGLALVFLGVQLAIGTGAALLALPLMITERWVLVTSYAANLTASLPMTAGLFFYIAMRIGFDPSARTRGWHWRTFSLLVFATVVSLYSYAAVRMPFVFSVGFMALLYAARTHGAVVRRISGALVWVVAPVACGMSIMALGPYGGSFSSLRYDLFVSWPKDQVLEHPAADGLKNFELVRSFDNPIWQQVARPTDGSNRSVMWTKTPLEILTDIGHHLTEVAENLPALFFLQPMPFLLVLFGACSLPLLSPRTRWFFGVALLWSSIWLSTFLLVPDPTAFRRGVAFPPFFAAVAAVGFVTLLGARAGRWMAVALISTLVVTRIPYELAFANRSEARMRMFTLCSTGAAHRTLLTSDVMKAKAGAPIYILPNGINGGKEATCLETATASHEWRRILPHSRLLSPASEQGSSEVANLPSGSVVVAYCNPEARRVPFVDTLCANKDSNFKLFAEIPNSYDGERWIVFEKS